MTGLPVPQSARLLCNTSDQFECPNWLRCRHSITRSLLGALPECARCSGAPLPPSPPAEKATAREDQAGKASASDGAGDSGRSALVMVRAVRGVKHEAAVGALGHIVIKAYGCSKRADIRRKTVAIE